jgi:hypothetical protein
MHRLAAHKGAALLVPEVRDNCRCVGALGCQFQQWELQHQQHQQQQLRACRAFRRIINPNSCQVLLSAFILSV